MLFLWWAASGAPVHPSAFLPARGKDFPEEEARALRHHPPPAGDAQPSTHRPDWEVRPLALRPICQRADPSAPHLLSPTAPVGPQLKLPHRTGGTAACRRLQQRQRKGQEEAQGSRIQTATRKCPSSTFSVKGGRVCTPTSHPVPVCKLKFPINTLLSPWCPVNYRNISLRFWDRTEVSNLLSSSGGSVTLPTPAHLQILERASVPCGCPSLTPPAASRRPPGRAVVLAEQPHISSAGQPSSGWSWLSAWTWKVPLLEDFLSDQLCFKWSLRSPYGCGRWHELPGCSLLISSSRSYTKTKQEHSLVR